MSSNPALTRMVHQTIYDLKLRFGQPVSVYKVISAETDYKTGEKSMSSEAKRINKCIVLPSNIGRELFQGISYISASKPFVWQGGQVWDGGARGFIFDGRDMPGYQWQLEDWIVYRDRRYDPVQIEELEYNAGWFVVAKEVKGAVSGGVADTTTEQPITLDDDLSEDTETP